jgi:hypothetical protein
MSLRYGLSLKLDMENAAFSDDRSGEVARILRRLADRIEGEAAGVLATGKLAVGGPLFDTNGNSCGSWEAKTRRLMD